MYSIDAINSQSKKLIEDIERVMGTELLQVDCPLKHHFSEGVYVREITMPTGSLILGHEHTTTHLNMISKGACILVDVDTEESIVIQAPYTFESKAGLRKLLYITEECVWSTVHINKDNITSIEELESMLIIESNTFKEIAKERLWLS